MSKITIVKETLKRLIDNAIQDDWQDVHVLGTQPASANEILVRIALAILKENKVNVQAVIDELDIPF